MALIPHRTQTGLNAAHPPAYPSESDPTTTLGAHRWWVKPSTGVVLRRNAANTDWEDIVTAGGGGGSPSGAWLPVRALADTNTNISSPGSTFDGITISSGDLNKRVLLIAQTTGSQNGIYDWNGAASAMTRSSDAAAAADFVYGKLLGVADGTTYFGQIWQLESNVATLGTSTPTFFEALASGYVNQMADVLVTSIADGDVLYWSDFNQGYENRRPPRTLVTNASSVSSSSTTLGNLTGYSFPVTAEGYYVFDVMLFYDSAATTTGAKFTLTGPASPYELHYVVRQSLTATTENVQYLSAYDGGSASATSLITGNVCQIRGRIHVSATGTVQFRFASEVAASAITVYEGSTLEWTEVIAP